MRPLCVDCIASRELATEPIEAVTRVADAIARRADDVAKIVETLSEVKLNGPVLEETVAEWAATETAGLIAWEERELARIRKAAEDARRLIGEVVAAKLQVGRGLLLQRMALLTTISELRAELAVPGATESEHASKQLALAADLDDIVKAFEDGTITVPSLGTVDRWLDLPRLAADLGSEGKRAEPPRRPMQLETAAEAVARAEADNRTLGHAILRLEKCRDMRIEPTHIWPLRVQFPSGPPVLPKMPPVGAHTTPRLIAMSVPAANVFLPLSDSSVLIGFGAASPLQVWDLELGTKTRDLEGEYELCASLASLSGGRIAAACRRNGDWFVEIHDLGSGQRIQELDCTDVARGLAYTNGHLLCASESPGKLWVFRDSPSGQLSLVNHYDLKGSPSGAITPMSDSTVAIPCDIPTAIQVWDWISGVLRCRLNNFGSTLSTSAILPSGRLISCGTGRVRFGVPDNWAASSSFEHAPPPTAVSSLITARDGTVITLCNQGIVRVWRDGKLVATFKGGAKAPCSSMPIAIVGPRVVYRAERGNGIYVLE